MSSIVMIKSSQWLDHATLCCCVHNFFSVKLHIHSISNLSMHPILDAGAVTSCDTMETWTTLIKLRLDKIKTNKITKYVM